MQRMSLKKKILSTIFISIAIAGSLATYFVFFYSKTAIEDKDKEIILFESNQISHSVKNIFNQYDRTIDRFTNDIVRLDRNWAEAESLIYKHFGISNNFSLISSCDFLSTFINRYDNIVLLSFTL